MCDTLEAEMIAAEFIARRMSAEFFWPAEPERDGLTLEECSELNEGMMDSTLNYANISGSKYSLAGWLVGEHIFNDETSEGPPPCRQELK